MKSIYRHTLYLCMFLLMPVLVSAGPVSPSVSIIAGQKTVPVDKFNLDPEKYMLKGQMPTPPWMVSLQLKIFDNFFGVIMLILWGDFDRTRMDLDCRALSRTSSEEQVYAKVGASHANGAEARLESRIQNSQRIRRTTQQNKNDIALIKLKNPLYGVEY